MVRSHDGVAVIVPCHNEEAAVATVVSDLRAALPDARIYVYDNVSSDRTGEVASAAGAIVRREERRGKGNVVRRAFADIDADIYVLIDGDDTYDAKAAGQLVDALLEGPYDHVLGVRDHDTGDAYRRGHIVGNNLLGALTSAIFGQQMNDMLSGYRAFSRRFVKSFPALSYGFEIETELTVHAVNLRVPQCEVTVGYRPRPVGSESKLRTYRDGWRILTWILRLARHERPLLVYGVAGMLLALVGIVLGIPVVLEYANTGLVPRFPTAVLASSLVLLGTLVTSGGVLLNAVRRSHNEALRLAYLAYPAATG